MNIVKPEDVWGLLASRPSSSPYCRVKLAENEDEDVQVFLLYDNGSLEVEVFCNGEMTYNNTVDSKDGCEDEVRWVYEYVFPDLYGKQFNYTPEDFDPDYSDYSFEDLDPGEYEDDDLIQERESELYEAALAFLDVAMDKAYNVPSIREIEDFVDVFKDHCLKFIADEMDVDIYRPTVIKDSFDEEYLECYPYRS